MSDLQISQLQGNLPSCSPGVPPGPRLVRSHKESVFHSYLQEPGPGKLSEANPA